MFSTTCLLALAASAIALPEPRNSCQPFTDTFEDAPASTAGTPISAYHGVIYQGFEVFSKGALGATGGIVPHSGNNDASASVRADLITIGVVTLVPFGNIVAPKGKSFDLKSLYFGCGAATGESQAASAVTCTVALTGFDIWGNQIGETTLAYSPTNAAKSTAEPMDFFTVPDRFSNLQNVTFGLADTLAQPAVADFQVDDVVHCNH